MHQLREFVRMSSEAVSNTWLIGIACAAAAMRALAGDLDLNTQTTSNPVSPSLDEITITAQRLGLLGTAATASEGVVGEQELQLTPAYRPAQLLETVPGLIST